MGVQQFSTKFSVPAGERLFIDCGGEKRRVDRLHGLRLRIGSLFMAYVRPI
jgi:hypothetical protein